MSDRPPELARVPSWADATPPWPGAWCRACYGTRWWTAKGWRCMRCLPPSHLPPEAIRRENEPADAPRVVDRGADPLFRQVGIGLEDDEG
jgi:hypothetical protein